MKYLVSIIVGGLLGFIGSRILFVGSALSLLPWAVAGICLGLWSGNRKEALYLGAIYGFVLSFIFILSGYQGSDPVLMKLTGFIALGLFGAIGGIIATQIGASFRKRSTN